MSALQTSVPKARLTNWISLLGFCLEEKEVLWQRSGRRELIPPWSLNGLHDTSPLDYKEKSKEREKKERCSK